MDLRRTRLRLLIVASLAAVWIVAAAGRLAYLQLFCYSDYLARALRQQRHIVQISPKRAPIYDRNLLPLAMSIEVDSCFAVPAEIADHELAARLLAGALEVSQSAIEEKLASSSSFVWIERKLPPQKARRVAALNLKGVYFQKAIKSGRSPGAFCCWGTRGTACSKAARTYTTRAPAWF